MSKEKEAELMERLLSFKHQAGVKCFLELLSLRRERYRDRLENDEYPEYRGRSKECKDLTQIFS